MTREGPVFAAIVLTGGGSTRMGRHKPGLSVGGRPIIASVLAAIAPNPVVVVGHAEAVPDGVPIVREDPPGGGPVAAIAAGLAAIDDGLPAAAVADAALVAILAGDLPFVSAADLAGLVAALGNEPTGDVALAVDDTGTANWLCAVWRREVLAARLAQIGDPSGVSVRRLLGDTAQVHVADASGWSIDVDTPEQLLAARDRADAG